MSFSKVFTSPHTTRKLTVRDIRDGYVRIGGPDETLPSVLVSVEGLHHLLDQYAKWASSRFEFSTYEWLYGTRLDCIRDANTGHIVAAHRANDFDTPEAWKREMVKQYGTKYPGITLDN